MKMTLAYQLAQNKKRIQKLKAQGLDLESIHREQKEIEEENKRFFRIPDGYDED